MKRLFICSVSFAFFMVTLAALAGVTMSDIWRWGLLRHTDILPVGSTITYMTGGVLRVVETFEAVDSNTVVIALSNDVVYGLNTVTAGVYRSASKSTMVSWDRYCFTTPQSWLLDLGAPGFKAWVSGDGVISNTAGWALSGVTWTSPFFGVEWPHVGGNVMLTPYPVSFMLAGTTNGVDPGYVRVDMSVSNYYWMGRAVMATNATEVTCEGIVYGGVTNLGSVTLVTTNLSCFYFDNRPDRFFMLDMDGADAAYPFHMTNQSGVAASGVYGNMYVRQTNEFVSAERLQDAVDDLRQEISEAIEAHVQLLHP